jgi:hypothetical protein
MNRSNNEAMLVLVIAKDKNKEGIPVKILSPEADEVSGASSEKEMP